MNIFDEIERDVKDDSLPGVQVPEGFIRLTRAGKTDIYLVQNHEPLGSFKMSSAYELDDFEPGKKYGMPLIVKDTDLVQHLGTVTEYFTPQGPMGDSVISVIQVFPKNVGMLPLIRTIEKLRSLKRRPTKEEMEQAIEYSLNDYHRRRAMLIA